MTTNLPGDQESDYIGEVLPGLPRRSRAAFAAGCIERVLPIVAFNFGDSGAARNAVDLMWRFALGEDVPEAEITSERQALDQMFEQLYTDDNIGSPVRAVGALDAALRSLREPESTPVEQAASDARYAAHLDDAAMGDSFIQEEAEWQVRALEIARTVTPPARDMFAGLPQDSRWLQELRKQAG